MTTFETFKLSELRLDEENFRTGSTDSQRDAIQAMIADQKDKLVNLAKDILAEGGLSPGEPIWVFRDPKSKSYVSVEGNRRVTALKLMENPNLADGTTVEKQFRSLAKQFAAKPIRDLQGCVFESREAAEPWVRKRHLRSESGVGLERWKPFAQGRANRAHGKGAPRSLAVVEFLQDGSPEWDATADALDTRWTTVDRVLNTGAMKSALGVSIDPKSGAIAFENGDATGGRKLLRQILGSMATTDFDFSQVEKVGDREAFLSRFAQLSVKAVPTSAPPPKAKPSARPPATAGQGAAQPFTSPAKKTKLDTTKRTTLAPKSGQRTFTVEGVRLSGIYTECRKLIVEKNENAAALLLRVFIELSSEAYLSEKQVSIPSGLGKKGASRWDDIGIPLAAKIQCTIDSLDPTKKDKTFQQARLAIDPQSQSLSSINTLHGYFHNRQLRPDAKDIMKAWDNWEGFLKALHEAR